MARTLTFDGFRQIVRTAVRTFARGVQRLTKKRSTLTSDLVRRPWVGGACGMSMPGRFTADSHHSSGMTPRYLESDETLANENAYHCLPPYSIHSLMPARTPQKKTTLDTRTHWTTVYTHKCLAVKKRIGCRAPYHAHCYMRQRQPFPPPPHILRFHCTFTWKTAPTFWVQIFEINVRYVLQFISRYPDVQILTAYQVPGIIPIGTDCG